MKRWHQSLVLGCADEEMTAILGWGRRLERGLFGFGDVRGGKSGTGSRFEKGSGRSLAAGRCEC